MKFNKSDRGEELEIENDDSKVIELSDAKIDKLISIAGDFIKNGIPAQDDKGHREEFRVKMAPYFLDKVKFGQSQVPRLWYRTQAEYFRVIVQLGLLLHKYYAESCGVKIKDEWDLFAKIAKLEEGNREKEMVIRLKQLAKSEKKIDPNGEIFKVIKDILSKIEDFCE